MGFGIESGAAKHLGVRLRVKIPHWGQAGDDRCQRGRHRDICGACQMRLTVERVAVNLRLERFAELAGRSRELD